METSLSPEAVEALARSLAVKLGIKEKTDADLANQMFTLTTKDNQRDVDDAAFKEEVRSALKDLKRTRSDLPMIAMLTALVAVFFSVLSLVGTARATERLSNELREVREHMVSVGGRATP